MASSSSSSSSLNLTQDELKSLEQVRQRFAQLASTIDSIRQTAAHSHPLPSLESLQNSAEIFKSNMTSLHEVLKRNRELFSRIAVHPSANFPGRTQEGLLVQLLQKKPEPKLQAKMDDGWAAYAKLQAQLSSMTDGNGDQTMTDDRSQQDPVALLNARWEAARAFIPIALARHTNPEQDDESDLYTFEERQMGIDNVRTGLRRELADYIVDPQGEDVDAMPGVQTSVSASQLQQRAVGLQGALPPGVLEEGGIPLDNLLRIGTTGHLFGR